MSGPHTEEDRQRFVLALSEVVPDAEHYAYLIDGYVRWVDGAIPHADAFRAFALAGIGGRCRACFMTGRACFMTDRNTTPPPGEGSCSLWGWPRYEDCEDDFPVVVDSLDTAARLHVWCTP